MTLQERIRTTLASGGEQAFEVDGRWVGWESMRTVAERVAAVLDCMGIGPRLPVGLIGRNRIGSVAAFLGLLATGRCVVPINPFQTEQRMLEDILAVGIDTVVADRDDLAHPQFLEALTSSGLGVVAVDGLDPLAVDQLLPRANPSAISTGETALLIPTSGTTGAPKRVPIRFDTLADANRDAEINAIGFGDSEGPMEGRSVLIQYSPLVHITGALSVSRAGSEGRRVVLLEKFTAEDWIDAVERNSPAVAGLPPTMMRMVLAADPEPVQMASLKSVWSGSAPVDLSVARAFEQRYGVLVLGNYGATEFCGAVACGSLADRERYGVAKEASVGRLHRSVADFRVRDAETDAILPPGEAGVLELRVHRLGPAWMRTSDLVRIDEDDFLYILGRADDAIIRGGFKIVPSVIADALKTYPGVEDVAVLGLADERLGQVPAALVQLKTADPKGQSDALHEFARKNLIAYQVPVRIMIVPELPRTPSHKIDKRAVAALFDETHA